jgi:hypothetical protein
MDEDTDDDTGVACSVGWGTGAARGVTTVSEVPVIEEGYGGAIGRTAGLHERGGGVQVIGRCARGGKREGLLVEDDVSGDQQTIHGEI